MKSVFLGANPFTISHYQSFIKRLITFPFILFILWSCWLSFEYFSFGPYSYVRVWEDGESALESKVALSPHLQDTRLGYWNPYPVGGVDSLSNTYLANIDGILFRIFPGWLAYGLIMWAGRFLAGYFTFRICQELLHLEIYPSLYAGLAYALLASVPPNGFPLYYGLSLPAISFFIFMLSCLREKNPLSYLLAFGLGVLFSSISNLAFAIFCLPVILFWFVFITPRINWAFAGILSSFGMGFIIFQSPMIAAGILNVPLSQRAYWPLQAGGSWQGVLTLVQQNSIPLGIVLMSVIATRLKGPLLRNFSIAIVFCLVFLIFYPVLSTGIFSQVGFLRGVQLDRIYLLLPYLFFISAASGLSSLGKYQIIWKLKNYNPLLVQVSLYLALGSVVAQSLIMKVETFGGIIGEYAQYNTLYQNTSLQNLATTNKIAPPFRVVSDLTSETAWASARISSTWAYGFESADGHIGVYSRRYQEYWEQVIWDLLQREPNYGAFSTWGNRIYLFKGNYNLNLLSLANVRFIIADHPLQDETLTLLPISSVQNNEQGVLYELYNSSLLKPIIRGRLPINRSTYIYENHRAMPRFFLVSKAIVFDDSKQVLESLRKADHTSLSSTAYFNSNDILGLPLENLITAEGQVNIERYIADQIILRVNNSQGAILIITNNFSPFWQAAVDGVKTKIVPVDHTFQSIYLPKGNHRIVLEYAPPYIIPLLK